VQRTLTLGGAKGKDDPIIVAACDVRDIIDVNDVVLKTNEVHWATSMAQYGQSEMHPICEKKRSLTPSDLVLERSPISSRCGGCRTRRPVRLSLAPFLRFGAAGGQAVRYPVVICRVTSKFAGAAFPGVYFN